MSDSKILATIERSDTEQLQISVSEYKGRSYLNMRILLVLVFQNEKTISLTAGTQTKI